MYQMCDSLRLHCYHDDDLQLFVLFGEIADFSVHISHSLAQDFFVLLAATVYLHQSIDIPFLMSRLKTDRGAHFSDDVLKWCKPNPVLVSHSLFDLNESHWSTTNSTIWMGFSAAISTKYVFALREITSRALVCRGFGKQLQSAQTRIAFERSHV